MTDECSALQAAGHLHIEEDTTQRVPLRHCCLEDPKQDALRLQRGLAATVRAAANDALIATTICFDTSNCNTTEGAYSAPGACFTTLVSVFLLDRNLGIAFPLFFARSAC